MPSGWWLVLLGPLLWVDYALGIYIHFPLIYVIPVCLAAWYSGRWPAVVLAVVIPIAHLTFSAREGGEVAFLTRLAREALRGGVTTFMALWFARLSEHERALKREVETLKGLLPICSFCKSIRNDAGEWEHLERFITRRSETQFSHGVCPSCRDTHYPDFSAHPEEQRA